MGNTVIHSNTWVYMAVHCYTWQYMGIHGNRLQYMAVHGYTWLYMAVHVNLIYRNLLKLNYMLTYYWVGAFIQTLIWGGRVSKNCFRPLWCPWQSSHCYWLITENGEKLSREIFQLEFQTPLRVKGTRVEGTSEMQTKRSFFKVAFSLIFTCEDWM